MRRFVTFAPALVALITAAAILFAAPATVKRIGFARVTAQVQLARQSLDGDDVLERINAAVRNIASAVEPSVVHIESYRGGRSDFGASGSGWVYSDKGHVVTNAHVVRGGERFRVQFFDGRQAPATLVGEPDPFTDIAVLKVAVDAGVVPMRRATGELPRQGDQIFVFGSPFGFKFSMSQGIVSGLGRNPLTANEVSGFTNFIQTDAAVNPGNSGGPLVDIRGRVIGMNVAIATGSETQGTTEGQSAGISFAIPLRTIESVVEQIIEKGSVSRGYLGVVWNRGRDPVEYQPAIGRTGVRIESLASGGPAESAGLRPGDLITDIDGQSISDYEVLRSVVTSLRPGARVGVTAWRDGALQDFVVTLGEFPADQLALVAVSRMLPSCGLWLGQERARIVQVMPSSAAERAGLKPGQVILKVGQTPVETAAEAMIAMAGEGLLLGRPVRLTVADATDPEAQTVETVTLRPPR